MANKARGEIEIELGGGKYTLRPEFIGLAEIEDKAGIGLSGLVFKLTKNELRLNDYAAIIYGGLVGGGHKELTFDQVKELIVEEGLNQCMAHALHFLTLAMQGQKKTKLNNPQS